MARDDFDVLVERRKKLQEAFECNNCADGIHRLLTELYPDTAHFVYELLQNAEDVNASEAEFILDKKGVHFAHNGLRDFSLKDVDSITNIGTNEAKQNDPSSIGEFGVGFKAVFSYTLTPEIHSGTFHFRIVNHFLPSRAGVQQGFLRHIDDGRWTEFYLPFNNPSKPPLQAFDETAKGLNGLSESTLLFLRKIKRVRYSVIGERSTSCEILRKSLGRHRYSISKNLPSEGMSSETVYLRYSKDVEIESERGKLKKLPISIAYELTKEKGRYVVGRAKPGRAFVYFPMEKEHSGLGFHINAPFSTTVARDGMFDCEGNRSLMSSLAHLTAESLKDLKEQGLLGQRLYEALPNPSDDLSPTYAPILDAVVDAFQKEKYLPAQNGGFVSASEALLGPGLMMNLLDEELLDGFAGIKRRWIGPSALRSDRSGAFVRGLGIRELTYREFGECFEYAPRREVLIARGLVSNPDWAELLYLILNSAGWSFLHEDPDGGSGYFRRGQRQARFNQFNKVLKTSEIVKCADGAMRRPTEAYLLPSGLDARSVLAPIVHPQIVAKKRKRQEVGSFEAAVFLKGIGVREYDFQARMQLMLRKYEGIPAESIAGRLNDGCYFSDVMFLTHSFLRKEKADFASVDIFFGIDGEGKRLRCRPGDLVIGDEYGNPGGDDVSQFCRLPKLDGVYKEHFDAGDCEDLIKFLVRCGAKRDLEIIECPVEGNPDIDVLRLGAGNETGKCQKLDFTVLGIPESLMDVTKETSRRIWELLCSNGQTNKYAVATYQANARSPLRNADSSLIAHLRRASWILDSEGKMRRPGEISFQELNPIYSSAPKGFLINALQFGSDASAQQTAEKRLLEAAKSLGHHVLSDAEYQDYLSYREKKRKAEEKSARERFRHDDAAESEAAFEGSLQGIFTAQGRKERVQYVEARYDAGAVGNPDKRSANVKREIVSRIGTQGEKKTRVVSVSESEGEEKNTLAQWYRGGCQICGTSIRKVDGSPYFEAVNIVNARTIDEDLKPSFEMCWNSMSLCPNCSAKYRYGAKDISSLPKQFLEAEVVAGDEEAFVATIELSGKTESVRFVPKHLVAIKQGLTVFQSIIARRVGGTG